MDIENCASRLFETVPTIKSLLRDAPNPKAARRFLVAYLDEIRNYLFKSTMTGTNLEWSLQSSCVQALRRIVSFRSEHLSQFSIVKLIWKLANESYDDLPDNLSEAFFEDFLHLAAGAMGKSMVYQESVTGMFPRLKGRKAAIERSEGLDILARKVDAVIKKYRSGLEPEIIEVRKANVNRILKYFRVSENEWNDPVWQMRNIIREEDTLGKLVTLTDQERETIARAKAGKLPFGITPYYVSLMDEEPSRVRDHAVRTQVIPKPEYVAKMLENKKNHASSFDFMMESDTSPVDLVTRRYPMIAILKPYNTCSQICVYCQRNWEIEDVLSPQAMAPKEKLSAAIQWLRDHETISEVLVTGGDPLVLSARELEKILEPIADINHVERIRIGSRIPVTMPMKITSELVETIGRFHVPGRREVALVTHFEHPYEITPESMEAIQKFRRMGISAYNQTVFTVENSRRFEMVALRRLLRLIGVDPYYTFNTKGKEETFRYRVPMARLQQEVMEEARLSPGLARTDEPVYNVPKLGKNYLRAEQNHVLLTILPNGSRVYEFHPWEKFASNVATYMDKDVPIFDFLQELSKRGENLDDYKTIYYYL